MRLLLWVLLVTLLAFISSTSAATSIFDSQDTKVSQLKDEDIEILTRLLAVESGEDAKRFLRGADAKDSTTDDDNSEQLDEDEERGILPSKLKNLFSKAKNGWSKVKANWYEKAFQRMNKNGETPTSLAKRLDIGGQTEKRFETLYEKYTVWWINKNTHPITG